MLASGGARLDWGEEGWGSIESLVVGVWGDSLPEAIGFMVPQTSVDWSISVKS